MPACHAQNSRHPHCSGAARASAAAEGGYSNATDLADYLVSKGVAFRHAHDIVGAAVRHAISKSVPLGSLPLADLRAFSDRIGPDVFDRISIERGLRSREVTGGTGREAVAAALARARAELESAG